MKKSGAIELSIGTIVIIVLAMTMLVLGIVLVKSIFGGATNVVDMTQKQLEKQVNNLWGGEDMLVIYPVSEEISVKSGGEGGFAVGLRNKLTGADSTTRKFSYVVSVEEVGNCPKTEEELEDLIITGKQLKDTSLSPSGNPVVRKVTMAVPKGFSLCQFTYKVEAFYDQTNSYDIKYVEVTIK